MGKAVFGIIWMANPHVLKCQLLMPTSPLHPMLLVILHQVQDTEIIDPSPPRRRCGSAGVLGREIKETRINNW